MPIIKHFINVQHLNNNLCLLLFDTQVAKGFENKKPINGCSKEEKKQNCIEKNSANYPVKGQLTPILNELFIYVPQCHAIQNGYTSVRTES